MTSKLTISIIIFGLSCKFIDEQLKQAAVKSEKIRFDSECDKSEENVALIAKNTYSDTTKKQRQVVEKNNDYDEAKMQKQPRKNIKKSPSHCRKYIFYFSKSSKIFKCKRFLIKKSNCCCDSTQ